MALRTHPKDSNWHILSFTLSSLPKDGYFCVAAMGCFQKPSHRDPSEGIRTYFQTTHQAAATRCRGSRHRHDVGNTRVSRCKSAQASPDLVASIQTGPPRLGMEPSARHFGPKKL